MQLPFSLPALGSAGTGLFLPVTVLLVGILFGLIVGYMIAWYKYYWKHRHRWDLIRQRQIDHY